MKKLKVYLDTSIINFLFADDTPDFKRVTEDLFENFIKKGIYDTRVSEVVFDEINRTESEDKRLKLLKVIMDYKIPFDNYNDDAERLAGIYIKEGIIPVKKYDDARHIGLSTTNNFDVLLSWNFKHLANINKRNKIKLINEREGYYYPLDLVTPIQLLYDEND
jgi:hypothetical protein